MRKHRKSLWSSRPLSIIFSAFVGLSVIPLMLLIFSALIFFFLKSMALSGVFISFSLISGAFIGSFICGKFRRRKGMLEGSLCGIFMFAVIFIIGLAISNHPAGIKKLLLLAVSGASGGVLGVNSKKPL